MEVDIPCRFLPANVALFDTAGLGSRYPAHALQTGTAIDLSQAVIYVLDSSEGPISDTDAKYIRMILDRSAHLFFVQTKIDQQNEAAWQATLERNRGILREQFGDRLDEVEIWPISNTLLRTAGDSAQTSPQLAETALARSRFRSLETALQWFLFRVAHWSRVATAFGVADQFHGLGRAYLLEQIRQLQQTSDDDLSASLEKLRRERTSFVNEWGEKSDKRRQLFADVNAKGGRLELAFKGLLAPGQKVERTALDLIEALSNVEQAISDAESILLSVEAAAQDEFSALCGKLEVDCRSLLQPLRDLSGALSFARTVRNGELMQAIPKLEIDDSWWETAKKARMDIFTATGITGLFVHFIPGLNFITIPAGICAAIYGWFRGRKAQLKAAQTELRNAVAKRRNELLNFYFETTYEQRSVVFRYLDGVQETVKSSLRTFFDSRLEELDERIRDLEVTLRQSRDERNQRVSVQEGRLAEWEEIGRQLTAVARNLDLLEERYRIGMERARQPDETTALLSR